jgi:hypothetical protein
VTLESGCTGNQFTDCTAENTTYAIVDRAGENKYTNFKAFNNSLAAVVLAHGSTNSYFNNCEIENNAANWVISGGPTVWLNSVITTFDAGFTPGRYGALGSGENGRVFYSPVVPSGPTYPYLIGDRAVNTVPAVGQPKAWVCTVAGSPGTWVSEGNL